MVNLPKVKILNVVAYFLLSNTLCGLSARFTGIMIMMVKMP